MVATPRAPLLPPLKEPVGVEVGEVLEDEPDPLGGVDVLLMVEPTPEVDVREVPLWMYVRFIQQMVKATHTGKSRCQFRMRKWKIW